MIVKCHESRQAVCFEERRKNSLFYENGLGPLRAEKPEIAFASIEPFLQVVAHPCFILLYR